MTTTAHALYYRHPGSRQWIFFDVFPTRELAFAAVDRVPLRHPAVWITEVRPNEKPSREPAVTR